MLDVLQDRLFVHCAHEISNRPYPSSSPVPLPDEFELLVQLPPRVLFDDLDHFRNTVLGRKTDHDMHVVGLDISFQIVDFRIQFSNLVHFDLQVFVDPIDQHVVSVSEYPYYMIHAPVGTVGLLPDFHDPILSYPFEDLGTYSIHGLTSGDLRRYFKKGLLVSLPRHGLAGAYSQRGGGLPRQAPRSRRYGLRGQGDQGPRPRGAVGSWTRSPGGSHGLEHGAALDPPLSPAKRKSCLKPRWAASSESHE